MSTVKWTESQLDAITARKGSVLVSAAAGSGKTAVLVQRVIETITAKENPVPIDRMLIVTFTRAAREEMLTRVERAINNLLKNDPFNKHLLTQRQRLYNAKITTIDGFCTDFVRQYFYKLDIQQDFRIADEKELVLIKSQALDNTIEYFYNQDSKEFIELIESVCTYRNDNRLRDNILKLYNFLVTIPFMNSWMDKKLDYYDVSKTPIETSPYVSYLLVNVCECLRYCTDLVSKAISIIESDETFTNDKKGKLYDVINQDKACIDLLMEKASSTDWDATKEAYNTMKLKTFPGFKDETGIKETIKNIRDIYKDEIKASLSLLSDSLQEIKEESHHLYTLIEAFFDCVKMFDAEFKRLKKEKNILDFSDIENNMIKLLCEETKNGIIYTDASKEISNMFDCIMVDEFQDINEVQNLIFKAISKDESNLFMVGDVKQSIYGFRQANPEIFTSYKEKYKLYNRNAEKYPAKIVLDKNFRSRECVLDACNFVFGKLMSPKVGGITYDEEERLNCGNCSYIPNEKSYTEFMLINTSQADEDNDDTKTIIEARKVAEKISKMLYEEKYMVQGKEGLRPVEPGDIAILLRTSKGMGKKASLYVDVLNEMGIIATASEKKSIFDSIEIKILLNLLRIIDNPIQDIPLLSVLMSPICGFTPDDLADIRCNFPRDTIYTALLKSRNDNLKCEKFLDMLSMLRTVSVTTDVDRLIGIIMEITGFESVIMALNSEPAKNISLLQKYAREYSNSGYVSLTSFVNFIDNICTKGVDLDGSSGTDSNVLNAVKVMSIHASKGLEFPVCFVCDTNTRFNLRDASEDMVIDADAGVGIRYKDDYIKYDSMQRKALSLMVKKNFISEEIRILYVAMTRAKEKLIITSGHKDPEKYICSIASKLTDSNLSPYVVINFKTISDWITACVLLHPSGEEWRNLAQSTLQINDKASFPWKISVVDADLNVDTQEIINEDNVFEPETVNNEFLQKFIDRVNFDYKYNFMTTLPQKVSASELSHKDNAVFDGILKTPEFDSGKTTGVDIGTAFHKFMEFCDLKLAQENFEDEANRLKDRGFLTDNQLNMLDAQKIESFINNPLITRTLNSKNYYREFKFTVKINSSEYSNDIPKEFSQQKIIMQGAVDLIFEEDDGLVIIDYKTDKVKDLNSLQDTYSKQLQLYKSAVQQSLCLPVKEMYIYSLTLNKELKIT